MKATLLLCVILGVIAATAAPTEDGEFEFFPTFSKSRQKTNCDDSATFYKRFNFTNIFEFFPRFTN